MGRAKEFVVGVGVGRCEGFAWGVGASNPTLTIGSLSSISNAGKRLTISLWFVEVRWIGAPYSGLGDKPSVLFRVRGIITLDGVASQNELA